jgi:type IV secretory pathway TrbF-like protein
MAFLVKLLKGKKSADQADAPAAPASKNADSTPYLDAQRVWVERYGSYVSQAYNWRLIALLEAVALTAAIVGLIYLSTQSRLVPYIVAVDKVGMAFAVTPADRASPVDERVVRSQIGYFISMARLVTPDRVIQKAAIDRAYGYVAPASAAIDYLDQYYPTNDPFKRAANETVSITINSVLKISPTSYETQWTETIRDSKGKQREEIWDAIVGVEFAAPSDEPTMLRNPLGMYITSLSWQKKV